MDTIKDYGRNLIIEADTTCCICLGYFDADDDVVTLPCNHIFHYKCLDPWLEKH